MKRMLAAFAVSMFAAGVGAPAHAADYPSRAVTLVVPYPPAGPNDVIARTLGPEIGRVLGQQFIIENRPGAGGNTAAGHVAKAAADGYTVLLPGISYAVNPFIFPKVPYTLQEFTPVAVVAQGPLVLVVHPSLGVKTTAELIAAAKSRPGAIAFGSGGIGTSLHLAGELFKRQAGVDLLHVPYKGTGEMMNDLLAGRTPVAFVSPLIIRQHVEAGKLSALGVTSPTPMRGMEQLQPIAQAGLPGFEVQSWFALLVPANTPADVIDRLGGAAAQALKSALVQEKLVSLGLDIVQSSPAQAKAYIDRESAKWEKLVREARIKVE